MARGCYELQLIFYLVHYFFFFFLLKYWAKSQLLFINLLRSTILFKSLLDDRVEGNFVSSWLGSVMHCCCCSFWSVFFERCWDERVEEAYNWKHHLKKLSIPAEHHDMKCCCATAAAAAVAAAVNNLHIKAVMMRWWWGIVLLHSIWWVCYNNSYTRPTKVLIKSDAQYTTA